MDRGIKESDWKLFRKFHTLALERFCERVLEDVVRVASQPAKTHHERYLELYRLIDRRDGQIARAFNDFRRSTAVQQLAIIQSHQLLSDEEFAQFSEETRNAVQTILEIMRS